LTVGVIYRVTVVKETTDNGGGYEGDETLFELAGSATMIARIAPTAIMDALITDEHVQGGMAAGPVPQQQVLADRVWDAAVANGTVPAGTPTEADRVAVDKPKRTRRTKQQIAEDEAREKQQAALQEHTNSAAQGGPGPVVTTTFEGAAPVPTAPVEPTAPPAATTPQQPAPPVTNGAEAPVYNPFAVG
jgi:hypothetical protein